MAGWSDGAWDWTQCVGVMALSVAEAWVLLCWKQVAITARPVVARPAQLAQTVVAQAAAVEATVPEAVAHLRYNRGSPLKVSCHPTSTVRAVRPEE